MLVEAADQLEAEANKGDSGAGDGIAAAGSKQVCQPANTSHFSRDLQLCMLSPSRCMLHNATFRRIKMSASLLGPLVLSTLQSHTCLA